MSSSGAVPSTSRRTANTTTLKVAQVFLYLVFLFAATQAIGLYTGVFIISDSQQNEVISGLQVVSEPSEPASALYVFAYVLIGALLMYLIIKFYKGDLLFLLIEFAVVSFASSIVFYSVLRPFIASTELSMALGIMAGLAVAALKAVFPDLKNFTAVLATSGAGAVFGLSFTFIPALLFLVLLSAYDYIAVFKTRHMVEMARSLSTRKTSFMVSSSQPTEKGEIRLELGTGDMLMPVILEVTGFKISPAYSAVVFASSLLSLFVLFFILTKKKAVLPAMPIIAICNLAGLAFSKLLGII